MEPSDTAIVMGSANDISLRSEIKKKRSENLNELFSALAKAQGEMKPAIMDSKNPHFNSMFASLTSVQAAYREPLAKHGLSIIQIIESDDKVYSVETTLGHSSGQWLSSTFKLMLTQNHMQGLGAALTYARRYSISALVGVVDTEDIDGADVKALDKKIISKAIQSLAGDNVKVVKNEAPASGAQIKTISGLASDRKIIGSELQFFLNHVYPGVTSSNMKKWQADELIALMQNPETNSATLMARAERARTEAEIRQ